MSDVHRRFRNAARDHDVGVKVWRWRDDKVIGEGAPASADTLPGEGNGVRVTAVGVDDFEVVPLESGNRT